MGERWDGGETTGLSEMFSSVNNSFIVNNCYFVTLFFFLWQRVHLADPHFHPRTVAQTRINKHKHPHEAELWLLSAEFN